MKRLPTGRRFIGCLCPVLLLHPGRNPGAAACPLRDLNKTFPGIKVLSRKYWKWTFPGCTRSGNFNQERMFSV